MFFYTNFFVLTPIVWSTTDTPGKVLWQLELLPENLHENLKVIMRMYNQWAGDFEFAMKIAGTGFHGGALAIVYTPPNIDPKALTQTNFTYFDYVLIDPKTQDITAFAGKDVRNVGFHWQWNRSEQEPTSFFGKVAAKAGYLTALVFLPLIASSTGVSQINIGLFSRLARNFRVGQMIPIQSVDRPLPINDRAFGQFDNIQWRRLPVCGGGGYAMNISTTSVNNLWVDFCRNIRTGEYSFKPGPGQPGDNFTYRPWSRIMLHDSNKSIHMTDDGRFGTNPSWAFRWDTGESIRERFLITGKQSVTSTMTTTECVL